MDKLIGHLATHVPESVERQIRTLAAFSGKKSSEYLRDLVMDHLAKKEAQYELMQEVFGAPGANRAEGND